MTLYRMKRSKSGAQKRKEAATSRCCSEIAQDDRFFQLLSRVDLALVPRGMRKTIVYKKKKTIVYVNNWFTQPSISKITESQFTPIPDDPCKWPESISDAQRCDIVKRGPHQLIMNFPYNNTTPRRRFSSNHYKRVLPNGESVSRSWLVYSGESDQIFCFCCKLFGKTLSPFCSGINTWEGFSKKLKDHENGISHQKCCSQWMLLAEGIRNSSTIYKREMNIFSMKDVFGEMF